MSRVDGGGFADILWGQHKGGFRVALKVSRMLPDFRSDDVLRVESIGGRLVLC